MPENSHQTVDTLLTPLIRSEIPYLLEHLRLMLAPTRDRRIFHVFTLDTIWTEPEQKDVLKAIADNNALASRVTAIFVSCRLSEDESIYVRKNKGDFNVEKYPYGLKSGPNIQFFRSVSWLVENDIGNCAFLMETDAIPLQRYWLDLIDEEVQKLRPFYIAGSHYKGARPINSARDIENHINGNAVINFRQSGFQEFLQKWRQLLIHCIRINAMLAYDVVIEWALSYKRGIKYKGIDDFDTIYRHRIISLSSIINLGGPRESAPGFEPDLKEFSYIAAHAAVLHCKGALAHRNELTAQIWFQKYNRKRTNSLAFDYAWQFPAKTEKHAWKMIKKIPYNTCDTIYFGFPWATLIDYIDYGHLEANILLAVLRRYAHILNSYKYVTTVCQHIRAASIFSLLQEVGVTDVFWAHRTRNQGKAPKSTLRLHPFPLYPVQYERNYDRKENVRQLLFSFIGMYASEVYLKPTRNIIFDILGDHPRGRVIRRNEWHYEKVVYDHQVRGDRADDKQPNQSQADEFLHTLRQSVFSLCPAGSGPGSIRLWESLGCGSIPVILADTYLPPGDHRLWQQAAVFCPENEHAIRTLPDKLAAMAADPALIAAKRRAGRQLWFLYGRDFFVHDIQRFLLNPLPFTVAQPPDEAHLTDMATLLINREEPEQRAANAFLLACGNRIIANAGAFAALYAARLDVSQAWLIAMSRAETNVVEQTRQIVANYDSNLPIMAD